MKTKNLRHGQWTTVENKFCNVRYSIGQGGSCILQQNIQPWLFLAKKMFDSLRTIEITHHWYHWILDIVSKGWHILLPLYTPPMPIHTSDLFAERADVGLSSHWTWSWNMNKNFMKSQEMKQISQSLGCTQCPATAKAYKWLQHQNFVSYGHPINLCLAFPLCPVPLLPAPQASREKGPPIKALENGLNPESERIAYNNWICSIAKISTSNM